MQQFQVLSGNLLLAQLLEAHLPECAEITGVHLLTIVLDAPWGFAFQAVPRLETAHFMIVTDNTCGEYCEDLWDLGPTVLIAKNVTLDEFGFFVNQAAKGARHKLCLDYRTPLTKMERRVLRLCATNRNLKEVAATLRIGQGTLKNHLCRIYEKLDLYGVANLASYYFSIDTGVRGGSEGVGSERK